VFKLGKSEFPCILRACENLNEKNKAFYVNIIFGEILAQKKCGANVANFLKIILPKVKKVVMHLPF